MFPVLLTLTCILILAFLVWASASIRSGVYLKAFCREKTADKVVYLTFDDGPAGAETEAVLDVLKARGAVATFFIIGKNVTGQEPLLRRILAEGHSVGIHTFSHANTFPFYSKRLKVNDIDECKSILDRLSGRDVRLFRPPFGVVNPTIAYAVKKLGLETVGWSVRSFDTRDYHQDDKSRNLVLDRIIRQLKPGSVILLHDRLPGESVLVSRLLDLLDAAGYHYDRPLPM